MKIQRSYWKYRECCDPLFFNSGDCPGPCSTFRLRKHPAFRLVLEFLNWPLSISFAVRYQTFYSTRFGITHLPHLFWCFRSLCALRRKFCAFWKFNRAWIHAKNAYLEITCSESSVSQDFGTPRRLATRKWNVRRRRRARSEGTDFFFGCVSRIAVLCVARLTKFRQLY